MVGVSVDLRALARTGPVHFMGAGGAGMCAFAELLLREGGQVSGCDMKESQSLRALEALGATVYVEHDVAHADGASAFVVTSAVPVDHPEVLRAHEMGIPVLKRAQALGAWVNQGRVVAIAGTHGKTTTTAMAAEMLAAAGMDPTGVVGGRVAAWGGHLRHGCADLYVVEADEYDRSFHTLTPDMAVITNIEADHLDIYGDLDGVRAGFRNFLKGMRNGGRVAACADDHGAASMLAEVGDAGYSYGLSAGCRLRAVDVEIGPGSTSCRIREDGKKIGAFSVASGGVHNLRNALGAAAAARAMGAEWDAIGSAMESFRGVVRRFERLGEAGGVVVVDDYAHHPTEIEATVAAARASFPRARLVAAFQPHLFSRTRDFHEAFGNALAAADVVWVTDVFPARERPVPGITGAMVADAAERAGAADVRYHPLLDGLPAALAETLEAGDVLLTLGAGSVDRLGGEVLRLLGGQAHA